MHSVCATYGMHAKIHVCVLVFYDNKAALTRIFRISPAREGYQVVPPYTEMYRGYCDIDRSGLKIQSCRNKYPGGGG